MIAWNGSRQDHRAPSRGFLGLVRVFKNSGRSSSIFKFSVRKPNPREGAWRSWSLVHTIWTMGVIAVPNTTSQISIAQFQNLRQCESGVLSPTLSCQNLSGIAISSCGRDFCVRIQLSLAGENEGQVESEISGENGLTCPGFWLF